MTAAQTRIAVLAVGLFLAGLVVAVDRRDDGRTDYPVSTAFVYERRITVYWSGTACTDVRMRLHEGKDVVRLTLRVKERGGSCEQTLFPRTSSAELAEPLDGRVLRQGGRVIAVMGR